MGSDRLVFYLQERPVGRFRGRGYPTAPGRVEYRPYRGPGHALLSRAIGGGEAARCWFERRGRRVAFEVVGKQFVVGRPGCRSHWYLDISRVEPGAADA